MLKKLNWRIVALIVFMIAAGGFIYWNVSTVQQMKKQAALFEKMLEKEKEPAVAKEPPPAAPGKKWVPHGDHFHEVPIDAPDVWQGEPHEPVSRVKAYRGPLTFHKDLLEKHPVEALRQQAREAGHWSAEHIPPFPPDDTEAAEFARELYLYRYYKWTGQTDNPAYRRHGIAQSEIWKAIAGRDDKTPWEHARSNDLLKLTWPDTTTGPLPYVRFTTTFTERINPLTARPLLPFELEMSNRQTAEND
ncbi:MAG: hypothetical protein OXI43_16930 [Candidatus Poribacteria bacterium]|nr:hypothetical protein [Candidatus Poribacteria bacterium]